METAILLVSIAILATAWGGGLYFRHVLVRQHNAQVRALEAENNALRARMAQLEGVAAPTLAADLASVSQLVESYARQSREHQDRLKQVEEGGAEKETAARVMGIAAGLVEGLLRLSTIQGTTEAYALLEKKKIPVPGLGVGAVLTHVNEQFAVLLRYAHAALAGGMPTLEKLNKGIERYPSLLRYRTE